MKRSFDMQNAKISVRQKVFELHEPHENYNEDIASILIRLAKICKNQGHKHKFTAYTTAAHSISTFPRKITKESEIVDLEGVGASISKKVKEILDTGTLKELDNLEKDPNIIALNTISLVTGIGPKTAQSFVKQGVTTLEKLKDQKLNHIQMMGLKYINAFDKRVPREEVKKLFSIVKKYAKKIDSNIILKCCGSYRRKCKDCGDIDILLTHPKFTTEQRINQEEPMNIISKLISILTKKGFLVDHLFQGTLQYSGVCKLQEDNVESLKNNRKDKPIARKIDIKLFPIESFYTGLLAYTGSGEFIRQVSTIAINKGFKLNEYQLVPVGITGVEGESIEITKEKDIFDMLGITYREPEMRSFGGTHLNKNRSI